MERNETVMEKIVNTEEKLCQKWMFRNLQVSCSYDSSTTYDLWPMTHMTVAIRFHQNDVIIWYSTYVTVRTGILFHITVHVKNQYVTTYDDVILVKPNRIYPWEQGLEKYS